MPFSGFPASTVRFLAALSENNDPTWLDAHRGQVESAFLEPAKALVVELGSRLKELDPKIVAIPRVRGSIHALERRTRFPRKGQGPYRDTLDLWFWSGRRRAWDNSGFFLRLSPMGLVFATGVIEFQKERLARYREHVLEEVRGAELSRLVDGLRAAGAFVGAETYKRPPRGVPAEHPRAALLKHGGLFANLSLEHPAELTTPAFVDFAFARFATMAPLHAWLLGLFR